MIAVLELQNLEMRQRQSRSKSTVISTLVHGHCAGA
jgi:hypothetical protein